MASNLESNRTLGGVGAIFLAIGSIFPPLSLVGIILLLVALKGLGEYYNENDIYSDTLYGVTFGTVGIAVAILSFISLFLRAFMNRVISPLVIPNVQPFRMLFGMILILGVIFVFFLLKSIFLRKAFDHLAARTGEKMFGTAGLLLLIGAALTVVLVGFAILCAAWMVAAVAFFSMRPAQHLPPPP